MVTHKSLGRLLEAKDGADEEKSLMTGMIVVKTWESKVVESLTWRGRP